ncbi:MAG: sigma-70 family RNA polymerase sigma factor [Bacteroidales bacterium]|nr:sigma-70 family RNA polymerase sigma factor [Bacteroidales bacterium]
MGKRRSNVHERPDLELITGSLKGILYFQEALYKRYFSYAMSVAIRYVVNRNEAIEIINDSFMKVLEKLNTYDSSKPFKPWYVKIIVNTAIDSYRKKIKKDENFLNIDTDYDEKGKEPEIETELTINDILNLFGYMPDIYKLTFNLYEIEGYNHKEIGRILGISESTSRSNLARAKKLLRKLYVKYINSSETNNEAV